MKLLPAILPFLLIAACASPGDAGSHRSASGTSRPLAGHYQYSSGSSPTGTFLIAEVTGSGPKLRLELEAGHPDGHGAAPNGKGTGTVGADGVFRFAYTDSFGNKGAGTFRRAAKGYALSINLTSVADARCQAFYGEHILQRSTLIKPMR